MGKTHFGYEVFPTVTLRLYGSIVSSVGGLFMSHIIKMNCGENHQMPAFGCVDVGWCLWDRTWLGRCLVEGQVQLCSQPAPDRGPFWPDPRVQPRCTPAW